MKQILLLFSLVLVQSPLFSQDTEYAKSVVKTLASGEYYGRGYVNQGDKLAAAFIADEFKKMGLVPVNNKSYFQKFDISVNTFPGRINVILGDYHLNAAEDFLVEASSPSVSGLFNVLTVKRRQIDTKEKLISVIKSAGDSFILIDNRDRSDQTDEEAKRTDDAINYLKYSPDINIKGIVILTGDKLTWGTSMSQGPRALIIVNKDIDPSSVSSINVTIDAKLLPSYSTQNVIGMIKGSRQPDSTIVVLAHYDHLGLMGKDIFFPGANDNASGVAMILTLARHYSVNKPGYTMLFIALSGEELGILGAKAYTDNPLTDMAKVKFLVNFDLAGTGDEGIKVVNGSVYKEHFELLSSLNDEYKLLPAVQRRGEACNSDHCLFYRKGVPCFYIYTLGGTKAYHDIYDRYDTLPLTEFNDYCSLMIRFFDSL